VATDSEMVEALPVARIDAKHLVNRIVEVAANSGRTNACLLRLEVQHLADEARFPEEVSVEGGPVTSRLSRYSAIIPRLKASSPAIS